MVGLEGILDVAHADLVPVGEYADDIESQGVEVRVIVGEVLLSETTQGGLFMGRDGFQRVTEADPASKFHFDEDEDFVLEEDQVDLPIARPVVALDKLVAAAGQVPQREVLTPRS